MFGYVIPDKQNMYIDIGAKDKADAEKRVKIGKMRISFSRLPPMHPSRLLQTAADGTSPPAIGPKPESPMILSPMKTAPAKRPMPMPKTPRRRSPP